MEKHKHLFLFPAAVPGILAVCWVSELVELLRERKKEKEEPVEPRDPRWKVQAGRKGNVPLPLFHFVACKKRRFVIW